MNFWVIYWSFFFWLLFLLQIILKSSTLYAYPSAPWALIAIGWDYWHFNFYFKRYSQLLQNVNSKSYQWQLRMPFFNTHFSTVFNLFLLIWTKNEISLLLRLKFSCLAVRLNIMLHFHWLLYFFFCRWPFITFWLVDFKNTYSRLPVGSSDSVAKWWRSESENV